MRPHSDRVLGEEPDHRPLYFRHVDFVRLLIFRQLETTEFLGSYPSWMVNVNGTLFFSADASDSTNDYELWKSAGAVEGTALIKDIWPGWNPSYPSNPTVVSGVLFFTANDERHGAELWMSDGTPEGTGRVKDINPGWAWSMGGFNGRGLWVLRPDATRLGPAHQLLSNSHSSHHAPP